MKWLREAAEKGHANSQDLLGALYAEGEGVAKNEVEAAKWFRKAAEQGDANSQYRLGLHYAQGKGVAKDEVEAYAYLNLAGIEDETARKVLAEFEKLISSDVRLRGQQRTKELQKEIEAKIAAKQAGK